MKHLFSTKVKIALSVALVLAVLTMGSVFLRPGEAAPMNNILSAMVIPVKNGVNLLVRRAESLYNYLYRYEKLQAENDALRETMAAMNQDIRDSQTYREENERLRELLNLSEKHTDYEYEIANVVSWDASGYGSVMTISKGSSAGVAEGMCAITESGQVVGIVSQTGGSWATVTTILDTTSEIGAYIFGSGYTCIAQGNFDLMDEGTLRASYLSSTATIRNGDQLLTSGDGDIYPPGLMIGNVTDASTDESNVAKYAVITPTVDIRNIEQVFLIKSYNLND